MAFIIQTWPSEQLETPPTPATSLGALCSTIRTIVSSDVRRKWAIGAVGVPGETAWVVVGWELDGGGVTTTRDGF